MTATMLLASNFALGSGVLGDHRSLGRLVPLAGCNAEAEVLGNQDCPGPRDRVAHQPGHGVRRGRRDAYRPAATAPAATMSTMGTSARNQRRRRRGRPAGFG